jgi:hypothetical protein
VGAIDGTELGKSEGAIVGTWLMVGAGDGNPDGSTEGEGEGLAEGSGLGAALGGVGVGMGLIVGAGDGAFVGEDVGAHVFPMSPEVPGGFRQTTKGNVARRYHNMQTAQKLDDALIFRGSSRYLLFCRFEAVGACELQRLLTDVELLLHRTPIFDVLFIA